MFCCPIVLVLGSPRWAKRSSLVSADIVSACFALPFERRLVLGTEDGRILLVNYVTGAILDESHPHTAEVGF